MRRTSSLLLILLIACFTQYSHAQLWSGVLSPSRAIDWSGAGVAGGIPDTSGITPCATLAPGSTASQINTAINSATCQGGTLASPKVVLLSPAGTYNLSSGLNFSAKKNIVLKGLGADQTILKFTGTAAVDFDTASIVVWGGEPNCCPGGGGTIQHSATWTGTTEGGAGSYPKGASHITLSSVSGLQVGNIIVLDQNWDSADGWPATGDTIVSAASPSQVVEGEGGGFTRTGKGPAVVHTVTNIAGTTVTIDPPLEAPDIRSDRSPGAWWGNATASGIGIENLTIDSINNGARASIIFYNALNCWANGIRSMVSGSGSFLLGIQMIVSARITVQNSYIYGPSNVANTNYGIATGVNSDSRVENNIFDNQQSAIVSTDPDTGTVYGYNYFANTGSGASASFTPHGVGEFFVLNEGNDATGSTDDVIHGTLNFTTYFRNFFNGGPLGRAIHWTQAHNRFFNYIGEVLGSGSDNTYDVTVDNGSAIFALGDHRNGSFADDPRVRATSMRWGNYDTVNAAVRFVSAEVPSGITNFSNPVPASQTLPASFYLNSKPAWFGSVPFPPIGPDVTGGNITGYAGHANKIPARVCYESLSNDAAYGSSSPRIKTFNAASCYPQQSSGGSSPPNPPTSLTVVVQ